MNRPVLGSLAILSLWSCLCAQPLIAAPNTAQAPDLKPTRPSLDLAIQDLFQHWVHSSEEEPAGSTVQIFRPFRSKTFPPSRFRMAYKFASNGTCEFYVLSPDDAHHFQPCNWTMGMSDKPILRISAKGTMIAYRITQLSGKILRLVPLKPQ